MMLDINKLRNSRRYLSQVLTLVESDKPSDQDKRIEILEQLPTSEQTTRIGISGSPGVGKSTFIEAMGMHAVTQGHKVAVLAVDPSSPKTKGSILGDKTRMTKLSAHEQAYVRPSPSQCALGGVARRTRESILLFEAAGYDFIMIETVGVGQSEVDVANMTDLMTLLLPPVGGDSLQGMKKGILELADIIVVNKADGDLKKLAQSMQREYKQAFNLLAQETAPEILTCSSIDGSGIHETYNAIHDFLTKAQDSDAFTNKRRKQRELWFQSELTDFVMTQFYKNTPQANLTKAIDSTLKDNQLPNIAIKKYLT